MTGTAPAGVAVLTACACLVVFIARLWPGPDNTETSVETPEPTDCETTQPVSYERLLHTVAPPVAVWPEPDHTAEAQTFGGDRHVQKARAAA